MYFQSAGCTILRPQQQYVLVSVPFCQDLVVLLVLFIKKKKRFKNYSHSDGRGVLSCGFNLPLPDVANFHV